MAQHSLPEKPSHKMSAEEKKEKKAHRLAQALRDNLRKRKEQARLKKTLSSPTQKEN